MGVRVIVAAVVLKIPNNKIPAATATSLACAHTGSEPALIIFVTSGPLGLHK